MYKKPFLFELIQLTFFFLVWIRLDFPRTNPITGAWHRCDKSLACLLYGVLLVGRDVSDGSAAVRPHVRQRLLRGQDGVHHRRHRLHGQGAAREAAAVVLRHRPHLPPHQAQARAERARAAATVALLARKLPAISTL